MSLALYAPSALSFSDSAQLSPEDFSSDAAWAKYADALETTQRILAAEQAKAIADGTHAAERESLNRYLQAN